MKQIVLAFMLIFSITAFAQDNSEDEAQAILDSMEEQATTDGNDGAQVDDGAQATIEGMDEEEALRILKELEGLQDDVEQVNQLGKVVSRSYAKLRFLDRLNAQVKELALKQGESVKEAYITVTLKACFVPANQGLKDAVAYLVIEDERESVPVFEGWMIASSPSLSAMDHPRYDVWVDSCSDDQSETLTEGGVQAPPVRAGE